MRGTLLNTATVAAGAGLGMALGNTIPGAMKEIILAGLGMVTFGLGLKLFLTSNRVMIVAGAIALGGALGVLLGIAAGFDLVAEQLRARLGGGATFSEGLISATILFCVGPMTLMGCIQDSLEGKIELLAIKSLMDGFVAIFMAATLGSGVLVSALMVLVIQGTLTLAARMLRGFAADTDAVEVATSAGGIMLAMIGMQIVGVKLPTSAHYLPALILAPVFLQIARRLPSVTPKPSA
ncbi:MAG: DUF554 domain-containing protein [Fimbriimonadaceae bacterium]|nr:DUF554 domain-containing protein [Fimbriimonadaceae bacterium]